MKFTCQRDEILEPLLLSAGAVDKKQNMSLLHNVLIKVSDNQVMFTGTDLEVELRVVASLENVESTGIITVDARKLVDIIKVMPNNQPIKIELIKQKLIVQSKESRFALHTREGDEFPSIDCSASIAEFSIHQNELKHLLEKVSFAMATQDVRVFLNGMLFELKSDSLTAIATDGHRLAYSQIPLQTNLELQHCILPRKGVHELLRLLKDNDSMLNVDIGENYIAVKCGSFSYLSKLINGRYPSYQSIIPSSCDKVLTIKHDELLTSLQRTAVVSNENERQSVLMKIHKNKVYLSAQNSVHEEGYDEIDCEYTGEDLQIAYNVNYLIDVLNVIDNNDVKLSFFDAATSFIIDNPADKSSIYVIMPLQD